ncbi:MAG: hypothetical protein JOZ18_09455 [Chloroflexi bacterium]|nr:hypothetical protein [Chloroflexota bacterium]
MEKWDARLLLPETRTDEYSRNVVELESRRHLHRKVKELIQLTHSTLTTSEIQQRLHLCTTLFGSGFGVQLMRSLHHSDQTDRQAIVWLLTILNDQETIPLLQYISLNKQFPRSVRLSASLALAGMGATRETTDNYRRIHLYAIS